MVHEDWKKNTQNNTLHYRKTIFTPKISSYAFFEHNKNPSKENKLKGYLVWLTHPINFIPINKIQQWKLAISFIFLFLFRYPRLPLLGVNLLLIHHYFCQSLRSPPFLLATASPPFITYILVISVQMSILRTLPYLTNTRIEFNLNELRKQHIIHSNS